jgi:hypothetical protein
MGRSLSGRAWQSHLRDCPTQKLNRGCLGGPRPAQTPNSFLFWDGPSKNWDDAIALGHLGSRQAGQSQHRNSPHSEDNLREFGLGHGQPKLPKVSENRADAITLHFLMDDRPSHPQGERSTVLRRTHEPLPWMSKGRSCRAGKAHHRSQVVSESMTLFHTILAISRR